MKKSFFILSLMATGIVHTDVLASPACPDGTTLNTSCWSCGNDCTASLVNGKLTIEGTGNMTSNWSSASSVPWYSKMSSITSVDIKEGITHVGQFSFEYASNLQSVTLPSTLSTGFAVGSAAFAHCTNITSLVLPETFTNITASLFSHAGLSGEIVLSDSVWRIGGYAFDADSGITGKFVIPDSVTKIEGMAFRNTTGIKSLVVGEGVTSIGSSAFSGMSSLETLFCPSTISCAGYGVSNSKIKTYTKDENGVYKIGNTYYASAEDMAFVNTNGTLSPKACTDYETCKTAAAAYKEAKIDKMLESGALCQTRTGCLKLLDMVSGVLKDENGNAYSCGTTNGSTNTIANCSTYAKAHDITLNDPDPVTNNQSGNSTGSGKRIYTVEEARAAVEAAGTDTVSFRIRYK